MAASAGFDGRARARRTRLRRGGVRVARTFRRQGALVPGAGSGADGRPELPAEHGFRFFPGFYRHIPDTMRRIPFGGQGDGVAGNLVTATRALMAQAGGRNELVAVTRQTGSLEDLGALNRLLEDWSEQLGIPPSSRRSSSSGC